MIGKVLCSTNGIHYTTLPTKPSGPTILRAMRSATIEELPWAMFAKGPACTRAGVPCIEKKEKSF